MSSITDPNFSSSETNQLKTLVERLERLEEEKKGILESIAEIFQEARSDGFDVKILRQVLRIRKKKHHERDAEEALLELYLRALH